jgi:hypothetical protein
MISDKKLIHPDDQSMKKVSHPDNQSTKKESQQVISQQNKCLTLMISQ